MSKPEPVIIKKWSTPTEQRYQIGNGKYVITNLHAKAKDLTEKEMPLEHLCIYDYKLGESDIKEFVSHLKAVMDADLSFPIILDDEGCVMDGRHRIAKALFLEEPTIKFVRFEETPHPDYTEEDIE